MFRSVTHFELFFVKGVRSISKFFFLYFCMWIFSCSSTIICWNGCRFFIELPFLLCRRSVIYICVNLLLGSLFLFHLCICLFFHVVVVQSLSCVQLFGTPWTVACQASLSIISQSLFRLISIELVMPSNHLILCCPLLLLLSIFPSIWVFSTESVLHIRWPEYWSFSFSISPSNEYSGLISIRIDWLGLLAVQGTLKSLLPHHSSKASILWCSTFFIVQLSHLNMTTGEAIALTIQTFIGKVMSLFFNMLSRFVIAFLPRSKHLLILRLQLLSTVILEPKKIICQCFHWFPICFPWSNGTGCCDRHFLNVVLS